jgi:hypothetical protein
VIGGFGSSGLSFPFAAFAAQSGSGGVPARSEVRIFLPPVRAGHRDIVWAMADDDQDRRTSSQQRFTFRFAPAYRRAAIVFGVRPDTTWVDLDADALHARFGPWQLRTPVTNISAVEITGPYAFLKTAGPARLSISDRGLTFASNGDRGVLISFRQPVPGIEPTGKLRHPELTVTVADVEGLASALRARLNISSG